MKFSIKDFLSKCDQIHSFLRIWSHLLKKSLMENVIFCAVTDLFIQGSRPINPEEGNTQAYPNTVATHSLRITASYYRAK